MCDSEMLIFLRSQSVYIDCIIVVQVMFFFNGLLVCMHVRLSECRQQINLFIVHKWRRQILLPLKVYE